ncbi:MAG: hypothetical protein HN348_24580 [Proteobacteria bacterium]|nr:hypothetical protein [Pseudomonadota bacterium]
MWDNSSYQRPAPKANHLIARVHGFMYFARVNYKSPRDSYAAIKQALSQVLHDARMDWIQLDGNPFG